MPLNIQGGGWQGGDGGRGPWGQGPGGPQPPNLEELLRKGQDRFKAGLPRMPGGARGLWLIVLIVVAVWLASGFYRVQPDEQGVVLRFGEWVKTTDPGLNYRLPTPFESALTPKVTRVNRIDIGFRTGGEFGRSAAPRDVQEESLMLTGDENIVDIDFTVFWLINDAGKFLFNIQSPEVTVKAVAESAMREIIGKTPIQSALTEGRQQAEVDTGELIQKTLDEYGAGIRITQVKMQKVDPPAQVIDSFRDVQAAKADQQRQINEAESYSNDIIPRARGEAKKMVQEAEAYKEAVVATAEGEAQRFLSVYKAYAVAKDVTIKRIYIETMQEVFRGMKKIIIDSKGASGVVPYLPLDELTKARRSGAQ